MGKPKNKNSSSSSDARDVNKSPIRDLPKSRSDHAEIIIKLLKKIDQPTMAHSNRDSYLKYLDTVRKRLATYDSDDERFKDYESEKSKANEKQIKVVTRKGKKKK
jgi:hypothetical protein